MTPTFPDRLQHHGGRLWRSGAGASLVAIGLHLVFSGGTARAADTVTLRDGGQVIGSIFSLTPDTIEIETEKGTETIGVVEYSSIAFDDEPPEFATARRHLADDEWALARDSLSTLSTVELARKPRDVREEFAYLTTLTAALTAKPSEATAATTALAMFLEQHPRSHHTYAGRLLLGDLWAGQGRFTEASASYQKVATGPPPLRIQALIAEGRLLAQAGKPDEAIRRFEAALAIQADQADPATVTQKQEASLGLARCLAATGKPAEAVAAVERLIRAADPDDEPLLAIAYVTLGACQRAAGQNDEAILSFLAVDLVHDGVPEARAEALLNLVELWQAANQPERSRAARASLVERFPESSWAKKLGDPAT